MIRDLGRLGNGPFDLLVVGGGIYGAWTAYDAALRGLKVALVDQGDWASATSSASSKLIHGGLRYLEQLHFGLVRRSLDERKRLARIAPHRVAPLRFLIPLYRHSRVGRLRLRMGLTVYEWLGGGGQPVARHESLSRAQVNDRYPFVDENDLTGGLMYGDCQMDDAHLALEIVEGAYRAGAVVANYVRADRLLTRSNQVIGAILTDLISDETFDVRASAVVNTTGMWPPRLEETPADLPRIRMSKGAHLILPALPTRDAMLVMSHRDNRVIFIIPWYGRTLLGTTDTDYTGPPGDVHVDDAEIDYLLEEANKVIKERRWNRSMIQGMFVGVRALKDEPGKPPASVTREWVLDSPLDRLLLSIGGKYTSARADASVIVNRVMTMLGKTKGDCPTSHAPFPWSPTRGVPRDADATGVSGSARESFDAWFERTVEDGVRIGLDPDTARRTAERYGTEAHAIHRLVEGDAALAERIDPRAPFSRAELVFAVRDGMALTLNDLLRRRTPIVILSPLEPRVVEEAAAIVAPILGWNDEHTRGEIDRVTAEWSGHSFRLQS